MRVTSTSLSTPTCVPAQELTPRVARGSTPPSTSKRGVGLRSHSGDFAISVSGLTRSEADWILTGIGTTFAPATQTLVKCAKTSRESPTKTFVLTDTKIFVDHRRVKPPTRKPTDAELAILRILWTRGPSTVRDVATEMGREGAYTTVLKLLQIMTDKQLVRRDESARTHVYEAAHTETQMQQHLVADLLERAFGGSAAALVMRALSAKKTSAKDLAEIRKLLKSKEGGPQ